MACSNSTVPAKSRIKRRKLQPVFSEEQPQPQEEDRDECRGLKKIKFCKTWENLDLILTLQSREINLQRKIEASFDFANSEAGHGDGKLQPVSLTRALHYVFDWMQSLLMSTDRNRKSGEPLDPCLDYRCWAVIRSCSEKFSAGPSPNLLRAVAPVLKKALLLLDSNFLLGVESNQLFENALQCLSSLLASNSRAFYNLGMDLWISCVVDVLKIISRVSSREKQSSSVAKVLLDLSALLLDHFSSFLRFHPNPKNIFCVFVERLLEQLFEVFVLLRLRTKDNCSEQFASMLKIVEDVMLNGLFHPSHISGFLTSRSSTVGQELKSRGANESYHRHLFNKLEKFIQEKKITAFGGFACLLRLFASKAKGQQDGSLSFRGHQLLKKSNAVSGDAREAVLPLFEVFMQFMKPLLRECKNCTEELSRVSGISEQRLIELHCMLRSVNEILESFIQEKIYVRTEDTPEGKHYCFLKEIYDAFYSISIKLHFFWMSELEMCDEVKKMLPLIGREVVVCVGCFLEIEYRVFGDDLVIIWLMLMSYLATNISISDAKPCSLLMNEILNLGCKLINVYSELRQVITPLFALCKAVKILIKTNDGVTDEYKVFFSSFFASPLCLKAAKDLLYSQDFRSTISNAVKSVPEGQVGNFVQQLNLDIADALEWIRLNSVSVDRKSFIEHIDIQAELLGRILSEIYAIVLESLSITATNSVSIGTSLKNLIKTLRPSLSCFLQAQTDNVNDFFLFITGIEFSNPEFIECGNSSKIKLQSICWLFLFFFRLYASSRSLYKQSISLMPPDLSHKASESLGDLFTTSCSMDWVEKPEKMDGGYFSWIGTSLISLPEAIQILSKDFLSSSFAACAPLVYILQICTLQRLNDLSRLIKAFDFFHQKAQVKLQGENTPSQRSMKMWKKLIAGSTREAMELTNFLMGHLSLLDSKRPFEEFCGRGKTSLAYEGEWDRGICSLDEKSLHVAVWLLLCQNIDVWFVYATGKQLKKFVSYLFLFSLPCLSNYGDVMDGSMIRSLCNTATLQLISLELLQDSVSYEQMMTYTNVSSIFCHILKKLLNPVLLRIPTNNLNLGCSLNSEEILNILEKKSVMINAKDGFDNPSFSGSVSVPVLPSMICLENNRGEPSSSFSLELKACGNLFNLFCKMPKFYGNAKSFSRYATYMLNIERFLLSNLLNHHEESFKFDSLTLFVSCRRAMKCLVMGSSKNLNATELRAINVVFNSSSSILWLFKSVYKVAGLPNAFFGERYSSMVQDMIYSLIDQTSYIFMKISEAKATLLFLSKEMFSKGQILQDPPCLNDNDSDAWEHVELVADALKEHAENFLITFKSCVHSVNPYACCNSSDWNKFSSIISFFQALLLGLTSASEFIFKEMSLEISQRSNFMLFCVSKLNSHVAVFEDLVNVCLGIIVFDDSQMFEDFLSAIVGVELKSFEFVSCSRSGKKRSRASSIRKHKSPASHIKLTIDFFNIVNKINLQKFKISCGSLLQYLFKDLSSQVAFILRQLFITSATILRVKCMPSCDGHLKDQPCNYQFVLRSTAILFATSYILLHELSETIDQSCWFCFAWLDGVLTFFDVVGSLFSFGDPDISKDVYAYFITLHLKAMGKCLNLQGKTVISSLDMGSDTKLLEAQNEKDWNSMRSLEHGKYRFTAFKTKLRMSIKKCLMIPSEVYLKIAIEVIEKKLVGVQQNHTAIYQLSTGNVDGGMVSSDSAASIECFELMLDCFSGHNQIFKNSLPRLVGAIINIVLHLRKPSIFYTVEFFPNKSNTDAGTVILMCVEVLTKVIGRRSFHMDSCYVSQYFHIPMVLFTGFSKLRVSCANWNFSMFSCNKENVSFTGRKLYFVDRQFSIELYTSCCRLMCSTVKHQKSEAERCIHLLEESLSTLLSCLEVVDSETAKREGYFSWELREAIKCASFLRRIYEEIRHQKDALGKYAHLLLSNYISTYSGCGPSKAGIKREIDEALRPGIYSLIDICTRDDLQKLHSLLSEGPCRSTLATLLQDYKQNFQYEGKI